MELLLKLFRFVQIIEPGLKNPGSDSFWNLKGLFNKCWDWKIQDGASFEVVQICSDYRTRIERSRF